MSVIPPQQPIWMTREQEIRAKAAAIMFDAKSRVFASAVIAKRTATIEWYDSIEDLVAYITDGTIPKP